MQEKGRFLMPNKRKVKKAKAQEDSYNRFFTNAFTEAEIDEIVQQGGAQSKLKFKEASKKNINDRGYWEAMFKFKGKDGKIRDSKFARLGDAVFDKYFKALQRDDVQFKEITYRGTTKSTIIARLTVKAGERIKFNNKTYRGGQFLPRSFRLRR